MTIEMWVQAGLTALTTAGAALTARSARRTRRQEKRDDFTAVTKEIRTSLRDVRKELAEQKAESERQAEHITDQALALSWLHGRLRDFASSLRRASIQPPVGEPIPERARKYIHIDV
ncbi:hypothetical protein [Streptomyces sp. NPDC059828]|uniref:hypothetical protein n=1 Tax=Streptomyces sp. NPDC059828 TaxID=3346965 RepID=UPI003647D540